MELSMGRPEITIGLIDGPVALDHPELNLQNIREVSTHSPASCSRTSSSACAHGTFVAGVLSAKRGGSAPAIAPECTLLVRPIFSEAQEGSEQVPSASPRELSAAIIESIEAGARVLNLSASIDQTSPPCDRALAEALNYAAARGVLVVAAAGNQSAFGSSAITRHPWVMPVIASDKRGIPISRSNLSHSTARSGLAAPGDEITSLGSRGIAQTFGGTSAATPFVTGTLALLWSQFPTATASAIKQAALKSTAQRHALVPPMLNAWDAYQTLAAIYHEDRNRS